MPKVKVTLAAELGEQSVETYLNDDELRILKDFERTFKINRINKHQPILEVLTLQEDRPQSSNLFDLRANTP